MHTNKRANNLICILLILILLTSCGDSKVSQTSKVKKLNGDTINKLVFDGYNEKIGDNVPITRAETAKIIALTYANSTELENISQTIDFLDITPSQLNYKYITFCANNSYMKGDGTYFRPDDDLTLSEASYLINLINPNTKNKLSVTESNKDKPVSYALWSELFIQNIEEISSDKNIKDSYGLNKISPIIVATNEDNEQLENYIVTDDGLLKSDSLDISTFRDKQISLYEKNGQIVLLEKFVSDSPVIKNAYIYNYDKEKITIFIGGIYRDYKIVNGEDNEINNYICDIKIKDDVAVSLSVYSDSKTEKVRIIKDNNFVLSDGTSYSLNEDFKIYSTYQNKLSYVTQDDIRVGTQINLFTKNGEILAGVLENGVEPKNIRVLLNNTGFLSTVHSEVIISSTENFFVGEKEFNANEKLIINNDTYKQYFEKDFITVKPKNNAMLKVESINRANNYIPSYRGVLEICLADNGFNIISDVSFDEYLYQVVPSEMPSSYGIDASMVQAICARTYAYKQYFGKNYQKFGANVDDSTSSQVYNNIPDNEISREAVDKTSGLVITFNNEPIDAFFFSTTGGSKASAGDVWASNINSFPSYSKEYLRATSEHNGKEIDLSINENADKFFKSLDVSAPEESVDWFRWNFTLKRDELSTSINNNLKDRYQRRPDLILKRQPDGTYKSTPIESIGLIKDIIILNRGDGGNVIEMEMIGTEGAIKVYTELNVRSLITPNQNIMGREPITLNMVGKSMKNYGLMPSAFFTMDIKYDENSELLEATFYGGGNGHGVGLSQNGTAKLLESGMSIEEVIQHYYEGTKTQKIGEF